MKIHRILNNNAVIVLDYQQKEQIVCGPGLAFNKKVGENVDLKKVNKTFIIADEVMNQQFKELISVIPTEHIEVADDIIHQSKLTLGKKLNESLIISLSDHISMSIQRLKENISLKNALIWEIKRFYQQEFELGLMALDLIEKRLNIRLPIDEAAFIATHIVNAETEGGQANDINEITRLMQELTNIVKYFFKIEINQESLYHYRFVTHLKFFSERVLKGKQYQDNDDSLLDILKIKYGNTYTLC